MANVKQTPPYTVGLTGGIGSGKSAAAKYFSALGATVVDADQVAREVVSPGSTALGAIIEQFGPSLLTPAGELDRAQLRNQVFTDAAARQWLEQLLHPLIRERMLQQAQEANGPYVILMVPLLLESQAYDFINRTLVVDVPETLQLSRASQRDGLNTADIQAIMDTQLSRDKRLLLADDIIDNSSTLNALETQVRQLHEQYRQAALVHQQG